MNSHAAALADQGVGGQARPRGADPPAALPLHRPGHRPRRAERALRAGGDQGRGRRRAAARPGAECRSAGAVAQTEAAEVTPAPGDARRAHPGELTKRRRKSAKAKEPAPETPASADPASRTRRPSSSGSGCPAGTEPSVSRPASLQERAHRDGDRGDRLARPAPRPLHRPGPRHPPPRPRRALGAEAARAARPRPGSPATCSSPRSHRRLWHVTELGARLAREAGVLDGEPRLIGAEEAAGPLQAHTLAVNDAAICFMEAARERGDDFGPFAWRHEVSHPLSRGRGRRRRRLIADAVFTYLRIEESGVAIEQRFLELDRATLTVDRLAAELARYAELYRLERLRWRAAVALALPVLPARPLRADRRAQGGAGAPPLHGARLAAQRPAVLPRRPRSRSRSACSRTCSAKAPSPRSSATPATRLGRSTGSVVIPTRKRDHGKEGERRSIRESKSARFHRAGTSARQDSARSRTSSRYSRSSRPSPARRWTSSSAGSRPKRSSIC